MPVTDRIEQALRVWELCCLLSKISIKRINILRRGAANDMFNGPVTHSEFFRGDVLKRIPFDSQKYIAQGKNIEALGVFSHYPAAVHAWATESRRIYRLEPDIQELILQTDVSEVTWNDIVFPYESFGIALSRPIQDPEGRLFDFLLVHRGHTHSIGRNGISIWLMSQEFERPEAMPLKRAQDAYKEMIFRNQFKKATKVSDLSVSAEVSATSSLGAKLDCCIADGRYFDLPLKHSFQYVKENEGKIISDVLPLEHTIPFSQMMIDAERLVAGLCVYLDANRKSSTAVKTNWTPCEHPTIDPRCITNEALVCSVQSVYDLSELERELLMILDPVERKRRCDELGVHYRDGHLRKRPGFGHDPDAPRCVIVRSAIIGLRRLSPGSLPPGTEKIL